MLRSSARLPGMPKKTKKQKLSARRNRKKLSLHVSSVPTNTDSLQISQHVTLPKGYSPATVKHAGIHVSEFGLIKTDLLKTLVITSILIIFEIILSRVMPGA